MDTTAITVVIAVVGTISAVILGWSARAKTIKNEIKEEAESGAVLRADLEYIKRGVDDMRLEQRAQGQRFDALAERVTRVEESTKQAHHRINRLEVGKE